MARIAGVDLPRDKRVEIGLTSIYGIGRTSATKIVEQAGVNPDTRCRDLTDEEVKKLSEVIAEEYLVEGDLRREIAMNIKRLTAKVTFNHILLSNNFAEFLYFFISQISAAGVGVDACFLDDLCCTCTADSINACQADLDALISG